MPPKKQNAPTSDAAPTAVSGMKVQELRKSLSALGADTSGTKAVLAARLTDLRKRAAAPEDEPPAKVAKPAPPAAAAAPSKSIRTAIVKGRAAVDSYCDVAATTHVYEGSGGEVFDALLNQTDIVKNANKFYVIQLLETDASPPKYYTWTRWGRVGEKGQSALLPPSGARPPLAPPAPPSPPLAAPLLRTPPRTASAPPKEDAAAALGRLGQARRWTPASTRSTRSSTTRRRTAGRSATPSARCQASTPCSPLTMAPTSRTPRRARAAEEEAGARPAASRSAAGWTSGSDRSSPSCAT